MKTPALNFTEVNIREMPGFETGGFAIRDLAPGMNIIYGPNASGKSSLGRAMRRLLRATDADGDDCSLLGKLMMDGEVVLIDYKPGKVITQQGGKEVQTQNLAPDAMKGRYILALADLLADDEEADELTKKILTEAAGGYDLPEAARSAGFRSTVRKSGSLQSAYRDAAKKFEEAHKQAEQLAAKEQELPELEKKLSRAEAAQRDLKLLEAASKYRTLFEEEAAATRALEELPTGMEKLPADALERLDNIARALETAETEKRNGEDARDQAQAALDQSPLHPTNGIKPELVSALREKVTRLEGVEREKNAAAIKAKEAEAAVQDALVSLGADDADATKVKSLDLAKAEKLFEFARRAEEYRRDRESFGKVEDWLASAAQPEDVHRLRDGLKALNDWLVRTEAPAAAPRTEPAGQSPLKGPLFLLSISITLVFLVAGIIGDAKWLMGILLPLFQIVWILRSAGRAPALTDGVHDPAHSMAEYGKTGLDSPETWKPEPVKALLRQLESRYDRARLEEEKRQRWANELNQGTELDKRKNALDLERGRWREELGLDWNHEDLNVYLRVKQLQSLFEARRALAEARATQEAEVANFDGLLEDIARATRNYDLTPPDDCELARSTAEELRKLSNEYDGAQADLRRARQDIEKAAEQISPREKERAQVFGLAGLTVGQEDELRSRVEKIEDYKKKKEAHSSACALLQSAKKALSEDPELLELTEEEISNRRRQLEDLAEKNEALKKERIQTQTLIDDARGKTDVAEKLVDRDRAADALRLRREQDQAAVTGDALSKFVRRRHHQDDRTGVFKRARKLFAKFTRGRFNLTIDDDVESPAFRCIDTATDRGRSLDELSSGTRIQLLLAVRIAFVESQEQGGKKMPFILDEALAISDELRAEEIIRAGIDICSEGRQFFYLTAQHDEVGKWRRLLKTTELRFKEIDLAEVREFSQRDRVPPRVFEPPPVVEIPGPAGMNHESYGKALDVPSIDPDSAAGSIPLWYVIEDPEELHDLLDKGINLWGQLEHLVESNNSEKLTADSPVYKRAAAAARALKSALKYRRVGRGQPVGRQAIKDSDACGKFLEEVVEKAEEVDGDGDRLIQALEAGEIKSFRKQKISELEQYLEGHGFIDRQDLLSSTDVSDRARGDVYKDIEAGQLSAERVRWLIQQVIGNDG